MQMRVWCPNGRWDFFVEFLNLHIWRSDDQILKFFFFFFFIGRY
jgi:hypothetical protein